MSILTGLCLGRCSLQHLHRTESKHAPRHSSLMLLLSGLTVMGSTDGCVSPRLLPRSDLDLLMYWSFQPTTDCSFQPADETRLCLFLAYVYRYFHFIILLLSISSNYYLSHLCVGANGSIGGRVVRKETWVWIRKNGWNGMGKDRTEKNDTPLRSNCQDVVRKSKKHHYHHPHDFYLRHAMFLRRRCPSERANLDERNECLRRGGSRLVDFILRFRLSATLIALYTPLLIIRIG